MRRRRFRLAPPGPLAILRLLAAGLINHAFVRLTQRSGAGMPNR